MKELTITLSADLTFITPTDDELIEYAISDDYKVRLAETIKEDLGADDCHLSNVKIFINDLKEDTEDEAED